MNGSSVSAVSGVSSTTATTFSTQGNTEKLKGTNNGSGKIRMSHQDMNQVKEKTKEKVSSEHQTHIWQLIIIRPY